MPHRLRSIAARHARLPLVLLALVSLASLGARVGGLGDPCKSPCRTASDHLLIFDEAYYVNAARNIAGIRPPPGATYDDDPLGDDPNAEHPQLAKVVMAGSIQLFGDGPFAWRLGSLVCGSLVILGLYALVRAAGGGPWVALGAATLAACDNLLLVHSRIGTLDIYALAAMVWAAAAYLRERPYVAGVLLGIGACAKEVAPYLLAALAVFEALRWLSDRTNFRRRLVRLAACTATAAVAFIGLLGLLDALAPPYADASHQAVSGGPLAHLGHIISYAAAQSSPNGPTGIASYPWQWLFDYKPIDYLSINPVHPTGGVLHLHASVHFLGMISPPIMLLAIPGLIAGLIGVRRRTSDVALLGIAWSLGTFVPYELESLIWNRTSYLYYMVVVMPGVYLVVAQLLARIPASIKPLVWLAWLWAAAVLIAAIVMYPFTPWPS
ncbi:MAG: glycosyltransferase family 39 protein [Solirubrobacteraceae bacterium]|jgi:dolichyl-phosphate-mannose-protein mannosyltransferase